MGRNQHSKDRMFITATEWKTEYGGHKQRTEASEKTLPFDCCALSLQPYETPMCTRDGVVFDILNIVPYIQKHKRNPVDGAPVAVRDLVRLNMAKNASGQWHCPVTYKVFNDHSKIVAVATTGNVFAHEAVAELNLKAKNWTDLVSGEAFKRADLITLRDPDDTELCARRNILQFKHLRERREEEAARHAAAPAAANIRSTPATELIMKRFGEQREESARAEALKRRREEEEAATADAATNPGVVGVLKRLKVTTEDLEEGVKLTSGAVSGSFTSTSLTTALENRTRAATAEEIRAARHLWMRKHGKKGYVQLQTTHGNLNVEVHCDIVPRASENFLGLCAKGYYDGLLFHRVIRNFMAQGGDPIGDGTGGESLWGDAFEDEFDSRLTHSERGVMAMANSGPATNRSQFYLTFKSCQHLDNKHTVFGRVVGGADVLRRIELEETDKDDRPKRDVKMISATVFVSPVAESDDAFEAAIRKRVAAREERECAKSGRAIVSAPSVDEGVVAGPALPLSKKSGVGMYLGEKHLQRAAPSSQHAPDPAVVAAQAVDGKAKKRAKTGFGDFSSW